MVELKWAVGADKSQARGLSKSDQAKRRLIWLPIKKVFDKTDRNFRLDVNDPTGGPNSISNRVQRAKDFWAQGGAMEPSVIHYDPVFKQINFVDGRHRLVAAYQLGAKRAPFLVVPEEYDNIKNLMEAVGVDYETLLKKFPGLNKTSDIDKVAIWMKSKPEDLGFVIKHEPIEAFAKDKERLKNLNSYLKDLKRVKAISNQLKKTGQLLPIFVQMDDPNLFIMEGRHRILAFWLTGQSTIPVVYVNNKKALTELRQGKKDSAKVDLDQFLFGAEFEFVIPVEETETPYDARQRYKAELGEFLNIDNFDERSSRYPTPEAAKSNFRLTYDDSVKSFKHRIYEGAEFVTPVMEYAEFIDIVRKTLTYIAKNELETNGTTGLHINISFKDESKNKEIDPLKLVIFTGDEYLKKTWPRVQVKLDSGQMSQDHIKSNIKTIKEILNQIAFYDKNKTQEALDDLIYTIKEWLDDEYPNAFKTGQPVWKSKSQVVNIGKLDSLGYVEFRALGGEGYENRGSEIENQINRFALIMDTSASKETDRKTYLKKLYKLLQDSLEEMEASYYDEEEDTLVRSPIKGEIKNEKALQILSRADAAVGDQPIIRRALYSFAFHMEKNNKGGALQEVFTLLTLKIKGKVLSGTLRSLLVMLIRTYGLTKSDIEKFYDKHYYHASDTSKMEYDDFDDEYYYPEDLFEYEFTLDQVLKILGF